MLTSSKDYSPSALLFVCMLCDVFIRPFYSAVSFNARISIISLSISLFVTFAISFLAVKLSKNKPLSQGKIRYVYYALFLTSAAACFIRTEQFYRYISDEAMPLFFFAAVFLGVALYCSHMPNTSLLRVSVGAAGLCVLSALLIIISNASNYKLTNLAAGGNEDIFKAVAGSISFAPEILLFFLISSQKSNVKLKNFSLVLLCVGAVYATLSIGAELVLGNGYTSLSQPAHSLARLGGISVFKRLDTLFAAVWLFAELIKFAAFFSYAAKGMCMQKNKALKYLIIFTVQIAIIGLLYFVPSAIVKTTLSIFTAVLLVLGAIISSNKREEA